MPTPSTPYLVIKLTALRLLWESPTWQDITGVKHGLFPSDPRLSPRGWVDNDSDDIKSFLDYVASRPTEEDKIAFVAQTKGTVLPGRKKWKDWVSRIWRNSRIHERIIAVLTAHHCHPLTLSLEQSGDDLTWPSGAMWIPTCLDQIAVELFGTDCLDNHDRLRHDFRLPVQALVQRTWSYLTKRLERAQKRFSTYEQNALEAFDALDETPTKPKVTAVIRAVAKWRNLVELLNTPENLAKIEKMQAELDRLMEGLGAEIAKKKRKSNKTKLFKLSNEMLKSLATEQDVQDVVLLYHEYFNNPQNVAEDVPILPLHQPSGNPFGTAVDEGDTGVEYEAKMTRNQLGDNLGFVDRIPLMFNIWRHKDGLTSWTHPEEFVTDEGEKKKKKVPSHLEVLRLHWHQLAGVHAILRMCFTSTSERDHCTGVLVADEVGLGKTYQSVTVIAFLADHVIRQREGLPTAPLLKALPYLAGKKEIPCLPHLIIIPGTLLAQWADELRILFGANAVDIFQYPTTPEERDMFWAPDGPFHSSRHPLSSRIIVAPHTIINIECKTLYKKEPPSGELPWATPDFLSKPADISKTLFGQRYLSVILDEAHNFRNEGAKHLSALRIVEKAVVRLILSATPLQTATTDLAAMGRLTGIPYFLTRAAFEEEKEDTRILRRAREGKDTNNIDENDQGPVKLAQVVIAQRMHHQSQGHILRRTAGSLDWQGNALVPLPPCETIYAYLDLTPRELKVIARTQKSLNDVGTANMSMKLFTKGFYMEYRTSVVFARDRPNDPLPVLESLEEWNKVKSTKVDTAARLCRYILQRDGLTIPTFENGTVSFPKLPPVRKGETATQDTKIVIFSEFPSMVSLFQNVFGLYGIKVLILNGTLPYDKRASVVKKFREDNTCRVLVVSYVGTTGINLAFCRVLIFLDQPWSAQDVRQMRGRIHRQPQKHAVQCYHLIANDTADILVSGMAQGKEEMMEAYLSKKTGQNMFELLSGAGASNPADSDEDDPLPDKKLKSKLKSKRAQAKALPVEEDEEEEDEVAASIALKEPNQRKSKFKSKERVEDSDRDDMAPSKLPKTKSKPSVKDSSVSVVVVQKRKTKSKPIMQNDDLNVDAVQEKRQQSQAKSNHIAEESDNDSEPPPGKKRKTKSKTVVEDDPAPQPKKEKGKHKPVVEEESDNHAPPLLLPPPPPPQQQPKAKGKSAVENDSVGQPNKSKTRPKAVIEAETNDDSMPPPGKKRKAKSKTVVEDDPPPEPKKGKGKPKPVVEDDSDVDLEPSPPKKPKAKSKPVLNDRTIEATLSKRRKRQSTPPAESDNSESDRDDMPPPPPKGRSKAKLDEDDNEGDNEHEDDEDEDEDEDPIPSPPQGKSKAIQDKDDDEEDKEDEGEEDEMREQDKAEAEESEEDEEEGVEEPVAEGNSMEIVDDDDDDDDDDNRRYPTNPPSSGYEGRDASEYDIPTQSEFSSNTSRSRRSSDVSMHSGKSDDSMGLLAPHMGHISTPPCETQYEVPGSPEVARLFGKRNYREYREEGPPSPIDEIQIRRRRVSTKSDNENYGNLTDEEAQPPTPWPNRPRRTSSSTYHKEVPALSKHSLKSGNLPANFKERTVPLVKPTLTESAEPVVASAEEPKKRKPPTSALSSLQPAQKVQRDTVATFSQLQGHSGSASNAASGSSSASASFAGPSRRTIPSNGSTIPVHRQPAMFERRAVSPPPALPPKKTNPFGGPSKPKKRLGKWL